MSASAHPPGQPPEERLESWKEIAAYLGKGKAFDQAIAEFAERYADQNETDYAALSGAVKSGRVRAESG